MKILLTNDDGITAPGIVILAEHLTKAGHEINLVAPSEQKSASSHSITLFKDITLKKLTDNSWSVDGTPADCMVVAGMYILDTTYDLVISGINGGQNMGEDIFYSGTVAAAAEAAFQGSKSIAISIDTYSDQKYETAAKVMVDLLENGIVNMISEKRVLNINVPNIAYEEITGVKITRSGNRSYSNFMRVKSESEEELVYEVGGDYPDWCYLPGTDSYAIRGNHVSITPLKFDLNERPYHQELKDWKNRFRDIYGKEATKVKGSTPFSTKNFIHEITQKLKSIAVESPEERQLRKIPFFAKLTMTQLKKLYTYCHVRQYKASEVIFKDNYPIVALYIIREGEVAIYKSSDMENAENIYHKNQTLGVVEMFSGVKRVNTAVAITNTTLLAISKSDFNEFISRDPRAGSKILNGISQAFSKFIVSNNFFFLRDKQ
ncbi:MAG: 5'/3'-nucleotidase SurE [Candidatus Zophobacter franzmannii]|nr:5'/3'-nucleotidase SurE [Candidatus Zophobacter franzmannii]